MTGRPPLTREQFLGMPIGGINGLWLDIRCECRRGTAYPLQLMCQRHERRLRLGEVLPKLRCKSCGRRPISAVLTDSPQSGSPASSLHDWRLQLLPPAACAAGTTN